MAYQGADETLSIYIIWMWNAFHGGFGASTFITSSFRLGPTPISKNPPPPSTGAPICPSMAYQGAETLSIYMIWMWNANHGGSGP
jgi:hypothetical protein